MGRAKSSRTSMWYLVSVCLSVLHLCCGQGSSISNGTLLLSEGVSFLELDSYLISETLNVSSLLLRFTFQTSELNSLLLLSDSAGMELSARIVNGAVFIQDVERDNHTLGSAVNNDRPHTLTIFHNSATERFHYQLDNGDVVTNAYATSTKPVFGANGFYFGRPSAAENFPPYFGCLKNILYSDGSGLSETLSVSISSSKLQEVTVSESAEEAFGDCRQCTDVDCGSGTCAVRWAMPITTFCDCRNSTFVGPSCSEDVGTTTTREFPTPDGSYECYTPSYSPHLYSETPSNTFTVQLLPPIPREGTIATAFSDDGYFSLTLEGNQLMYRYSTSTLLRRNNGYEALSVTLDDRNIEYRVEVTVLSHVATLSLTPIPNGSPRSNRDIINLNAQQALFYSTVCIGGTLLEMTNYIGRLRRATFNQHSLFEERNFLQLQRKSLSPSNHIAAVDSPTNPPISFENVDFRSRMRFEMRTTQEGGSVFWITSGQDSIFATTVTNHLSFGVSLPEFGQHLIGRSIAVADNEWHQVEFQTIYTGSGNDRPLLYVDGELITIIVPMGDLDIFNFTNFIGAPINFGSGSMDQGMPFLGCIRNIVFETPDSEVFCPNLDFMELFDDQRYAVNKSCFSCSVQKTCPTGQTCFDPGYDLDSVCVDPSLPINTTCPSSLSTTTSPPQTTLPLVTDTPTNVMPMTSSPDTATDSTADGSQSSSQHPPTTTKSNTTGGGGGAGGGGGLSSAAAVGIGVGVALLIAVILVIIFILIWWFLTQSHGRGFYRTNETNDGEVSMGRFQASLGHNSVEAISPNHSIDEKPNGINRTNLSNGGPLHSNSVPSTSKEKEYFL